MVQITVDTNTDSLEDLEQAKQIIDQAIQRRKGTRTTTAAPTKKVSTPTAQELVEETAIDTPFFKITVASDDEPSSPSVAEPTVNDLLANESITEDELSELFKHAPEVDPPERAAKKRKEQDDAYIEIVEFDEEKPR